MSISVLTRGYNNGRDGANRQESVLTAAAVRTRGIRRLFSLPLPGDRRGAEAQPLIVPGVALPNGRTRDLVVIATMANQVFAFDANDGTPVWQHALGTPIISSGRIDEHPINDHWGILSTPVVDASAGVMYACAWVSPDGSYTGAPHRLHALSIVDGHALHPPLNLEGATYNPGHGQPVQTFASATRKQRASLLLVSETMCLSPSAPFSRQTGTAEAGSSLATPADLGGVGRCGEGLWRRNPAGWVRPGRRCAT